MKKFKIRRCKCCGTPATSGLTNGRADEGDFYCSRGCALKDNPEQGDLLSGVSFSSLIEGSYEDTLVHVIRCHVLRDQSLRHGANGSLRDHGTLFLAVEEEREDDMLLPADQYDVLVEKRTGPIVVAEPLSEEIHRYNGIPCEADMKAGGCWIFSADDRFPSNHPIPLHDRRESRECERREEPRSRVVYLDSILFD